MVGARNGSAVGQKLTRQLATELVETLAPMLGRPVEPFGPELSAPEDGAAPF